MADLRYFELTAHFLVPKLTWLLGRVHGVFGAAERGLSGAVWPRPVLSPGLPAASTAQRRDKLSTDLSILLP